MIVGEIKRVSFEKWNLEYSNKIVKLRMAIERMKSVSIKTIELLDQKLDLLIDIKQIFCLAVLLQKRELI